MGIDDALIYNTNFYFMLQTYVICVKGANGER